MQGRNSEANAPLIDPCEKETELREEGGCYIRDLTARKQAGEALQRAKDYTEKLIEIEGAQRRLLDLIEATPDFISTCDANRRPLYYNKAARQLLGFREDEDLSNITIPQTHPEWANKIVLDEGIPTAIREGVWRGESALLSRDGREIPVSQVIIAHKNADGTVDFISTIARDISERKDAENALRKAHNELELHVLERTAELAEANEELLIEKERFRSVAESASDAIISVDGRGNLIFWNQAAEAVFGYSADEIIGKHFTSIVPESFRQFVKSSVNALATTGEANIVKKPFDAVGLRKDGSEFPTEVSFGAWKSGDQMFFTGIIRDVTERKQAEANLRESLEKLSKTMKSTVEAMALTSELRDPYTAGHQRRVAQVARAIAEEMNLSQDQVDGVHLAAVVHDIGKICVPAEILSKPGKISEIEFSLIKAHPQVGYDILKRIEFPWPIAKIVLQHHEKIDGSGYPLGLSGQDILLEAKILCVADVVEAIASHRPYRPSLGVDIALEEISQHRGSLYDPVVVEACLRLFSQRGFEFE